MTIRQQYRQHLLWAVHQWMRCHGVWFVFALLFFVVMDGGVFAAETKINDAGLMANLSKEGVSTPKTQPEEKKKAKFVLPDPNPDDIKAKGEPNEAVGTISARNKYGMAVEYAVDAKKGTSEEIWVNFHKKLKLSGMKDLSELGEGDKVKIQYKVTKGTTRILLNEIKLISKKPKEKPQLLVSEEIQGAS